MSGRLGSLMIFNDSETGQRARAAWDEVDGRTGMAFPPVRVGFRR